MRKQKKISITLLLVLFLLTIAGCRTTKVETVTLPPKPQRQELSVPKNLKDYAELLNYYETLVQEWEAWGEAATEILKLE